MEEGHGTEGVGEVTACGDEVCAQLAVRSRIAQQNFCNSFSHREALSPSKSQASPVIFLVAYDPRLT